LALSRRDERPDIFFHKLDICRTLQLEVPHVILLTYAL